MASQAVIFLSKAREKKGATQRDRFQLQFEKEEKRKEETDLGDGTNGTSKSLARDSPFIFLTRIFERYATQTHARLNEFDKKDAANGLVAAMVADAFIFLYSFFL